MSRSQAVMFRIGSISPYGPIEMKARICVGFPLRQFQAQFTVSRNAAIYFFDDRGQDIALWLNVVG